jgi:hypothetical protein
LDFHRNSKNQEKQVFDFLYSRHHKLKMKVYIDQLKVQAAELRKHALRSPKAHPSESLENQIKLWWTDLPPSIQYRRFHICEIAAQCNGHFKEKPALRKVASALRSLGWKDSRDWTKSGRNRRFWKPPSEKTKSANIVI